MYAEDVSGSGRRKINQGKLLIVAQGHTFYFAQATLRHMHTSLICQGFLTLVALDAREQPYQLLAVAAADAEERTLHLPHMHMPYQDACLTTTLATIQEHALQDAALVRRELRTLTLALTRTLARILTRTL